MDLCANKLSCDDKRRCDGGNICGGDIKCDYVKYCKYRVYHGEATGTYPDGAIVNGFKKIGTKPSNGHYVEVWECTWCNDRIQANYYPETDSELINKYMKKTDLSLIMSTHHVWHIAECQVKNSETFVRLADTLDKLENKLT